MSDEQLIDDELNASYATKIRDIIRHVAQEHGTESAVVVLMAAFSGSAWMLGKLAREDAAWFSRQSLDLIFEAAERKRRIETERN